LETTVFGEPLSLPWKIELRRLLRSWKPSNPKVDPAGFAILNCQRES
jgi:hypothetical protein